MLDEVGERAWDLGYEGTLGPWIWRDQLYLSMPQLPHLQLGDIINDTWLPWIIVRLVLSHFFIP